MTTRTTATLEDLMRVPGKAELINGEIVTMPPTGDAPGRAGDRIYLSLQKHEDETGIGRAVSDNKAFHVDLPHRESFSPVWDVDLLAEDVVRKYQASDPHHPATFRRGQTADAEPAVPGWTMKLDEVFR